MRRLTGKHLGVSALGDEAKNELTKVQGITTALAERLADEGVSSIPQLAYSDPIDLTIRSNLNFGYIIDSISQALAWLYFEDNIAIAKRFALRGSFEIDILVTELRYEEGAHFRETAQTTLSELAREMNLHPDCLERLLLDICEDRYAQFIRDII